MNTGIDTETAFRQKLKEKVFASLKNYHTDNVDIHRIDRNNGHTGLLYKLKRTARTSARSLLKGFDYFNSAFFDQIVGQMNEVTDSFSYLYAILEDENSKNLLVDIGAYRVLGNTRIKLPLSQPSYWKGIEAVEQLADKSEAIVPGFEDFKLYKFDLNSIGFPVQLYFNSQGIYTDFVLKQYEYNKGNTVIKVEEGDHVIDGGGCWGDTALFFANGTGGSGRVYSFEFIPGNIAIFNKNTALNPALESNVNIIKHPLWSKSDKDVYFVDNGPASRVYFEEPAQYTGKTHTLTIDDFVKRNKVDKVDFIKLDIEGAETNALLGARETIARFKPKLAIALYHDVKDFLAIPQYLQELDLGYKFFIDHFTIHHEETVLFASVDV